MKSIVRAVIVLFCGIAPAAIIAQAEPASAPCTPKFPLEHNQIDGWLGADAAYSIPLPDGRDVWIFGDTLYGKKRVVRDGTPQMVRNSIGISTCKNGRWKLHYVIRKDANGQPQSFFEPQHPDSWYWAMDGFIDGHDLWVTLLCVRNSPAKSQAMAFATCGTDLARISSPGPDPQQWKIDYFPLVPDGTHAYPSAAVTSVAKHEDLFALYEQGTRPLLVTRLPLEGLDHPEKQLEYLASDGQWRSGFDPSHAFQVMAKGSPELSIRYHPELKQWVSIMFDPDAFSSKILLRTAPAPTGPWSKGKVIYQVPVMQMQNPGYDKNTFCYAAKEHPEFEQSNLVFTYVCNTFDVQSLATNTGIYFPRVVRMPWPKE